VLRCRSQYRHEKDDLLGEGGLALARALQRPDIDDLAGYVFRSSRRAMVRYLYRLPRPPIGYRPPSRLTERELVLRHCETLAEINSVCSDEIDQEIVTRREAGETLAEIGTALGLDKSTVSRRLSAILDRFHATFDR
jgi:DNA-directed RNA polymerase specialized sigma subunit